MAISVAAFKYNENYHPVSDELWKSISEKCDAANAREDNDWFYRESLIKLCLISAVYGGYLGIVADSHFLGGTR